jgi:hypothetical protein
VTYAIHLAPKTRATYAAVWDRHVAPHLGSRELRSISPGTTRHNLR